MPVRSNRHRSEKHSPLHAPEASDPRHASSTVVVLLRRPGQPRESLRFRAEELEALLREVGLAPRCELVLTRSGGARRSLFGPGALHHLRALIAASEPDTDAPRQPPVLMVDAALSPAEHRALLQTGASNVLDRPQLILRLFALRARTREAQLTIQIAQLRYGVPRLRDDTSRRGRAGGGGGRGERGNTQTALDKERARTRIAALEGELAHVQQMAERQRARRRGERRVALVGYTNAGKSSWLHALTGSTTLIADKPFATLDTSVRMLATKSACRDPVLITDTVGFLRDLPHELVPSFHATLVEAQEADLCLYIVDASDPSFREQLQVTQQTLDGIGAGAVPRRILLNKIDRVDAETRARLASEWPDALQVSSASQASVAEVRALIAEHFAPSQCVSAATW